MEEKVTKVKRFPTFWTYLKRNGVTTIHQVRFKSLLTQAMTLDFNSGQETKVVFSVFEIANTIGHWLGGQIEGGSQRNFDNRYHDLSDIFATKEDAIKASQGFSVNREFKPINYKDGIYRISKESILYKSDWLWFNNVPQGMFVRKIDSELHLCGYFWNGIKSVIQTIPYDYSNGLNIFGFGYKTKSTDALFDMVGGDFIGEPTKHYYKTQEECDASHQIQVFEFDD